MDPIRERFQLHAFNAFYKAALLGGEQQLEAFVTAIIKSSDEETDKVLEKNPAAIRQYMAFVADEKKRKKLLAKPKEIVNVD